jgi:hypothetical protein
VIRTISRCDDRRKMTMTAGPPISTSFGRYQEEAVLFNRIMPCEPFCAIFGWLRAATQNHLAPMCTAQKTTDGNALTSYEHTRVSRQHPRISIHLGGTIEAYCHCAASCYSATASNGCAASYHCPSAHLSDGFSAAVLPAAALATAVLHISSWLWTCRMTWFNQCHLEALKRPTNL